MRIIFIAIVMAAFSTQANATDASCCSGEWERFREQIHCDSGYYWLSFRTQTMMYRLPILQDRKPIECMEGAKPNNKAVSAAFETMKQHFAAE